MLGKKEFSMITKLALSLGIFGILSFFFLDQKIAQYTLQLGVRTTLALRMFTFLFSPAFHILGSTALALLAYFLALPQRLPLYTYALAQVVAGTTVQVAKNLIGRARPLIAGLDPYLVMPISFAPQYHSFPSGHACVCATIGALFCFFFPKYKVPILLTAVMLPLIRVVQMKHFMSDVCLGLCVGFLITQSTISLFSQFMEKKRPELVQKGILAP